MNQMEMVIGEEHKAGAAGKWLDIVNPATEEVQARVPIAEASDVDHARANRPARFRRGAVGQDHAERARAAIVYASWS